MSSTDSVSIIHKKARVAREDFDLRAMSPAKAIRLSLARRADDLFDLPVVVKTLEQTRVTTDELTKELDEQGMLLLLDGVDGRRGVASMDGNFISALIEQQISGRVREGDVQPRSYTRTDAAMVAPLLDATLEGLDAKMAEHDPDYVHGAFRFGDRVEDTRALSLALDQGRFDLFKLTVDIAEGARSGVFILGLPHVPPAQKTATPDASQSDHRGGGIKSVALDASIPLTAVIARINQPLNLICAFQPGMVLPLPADCLSQVELSARPRHLVAEVQLGQVNGMRAVRLRLPTDEDAPTVVLPDPVTQPGKPAQEAQEPSSAMPAISQDEPQPLADLPDDWSPEDDLPEFAMSDQLPLASMSST